MDCINLTSLPNKTTFLNKITQAMLNQNHPVNFRYLIMYKQNNLNTIGYKIITFKCKHFKY